MIPAWEEQMEEVINLAYTDQRAAKELVLKILPLYSGSEREYMKLCHQLGIINTLLGQYEEAENNILEAMAIAEQSSDTPISEFADMARHLTIVYEAKTREGK